MKPDDLTLMAFLTAQDIGTIQEMGADILEEYGHTPESTPYTEMLFLGSKDKNIPVEKFPTLIAEYLIALDFESISISRLIPNKKFPPGPENAQYLWKFETDDKDRGKSIITVTVFPEYIIFNSMEC